MQAKRTPYLAPRQELAETWLSAQKSQLTRKRKLSDSSASPLSKHCKTLEFSLPSSLPSAVKWPLPRHDAPVKQTQAAAAAAPTQQPRKRDLGTSLAFWGLHRLNNPEVAPEGSLSQQELADSERAAEELLRSYKVESEQNLTQPTPRTQCREPGCSASVENFVYRVCKSHAVTRIYRPDAALFERRREKRRAENRAAADAFTSHTTRTRRKTGKAPCSVTDCGRPQRARKLCSKHYLAARRQLKR